MQSNFTPQLSFAMNYDFKILYGKKIEGKEKERKSEKKKREKKSDNLVEEKLCY